ncbi:MAG: DUF3500 domain-containing protein [Verrucomicrobiales bacterium]|nr:DUF3500 domain-containing protein [Verrucomicrobiales bacterium]
MSTTDLTRRAWLRRSSQATLAALASPSLTQLTRAAPAPASETLVTQLYGSLDETQRSALCLPWDHELRLKVDNNWHITPTPINKILQPDQVDLVRQIFDGLHSDEYKKEVWRQFDQDNKRDGGFGSASIALFGQPGSGQFEFVLTGRHCTRRCDGDSEAGTAFGGPIFYGHAAQSFNETAQHPGNAYWYQAQRANELFQALDGKQRQQALQDGKSPAERGNRTVALSGKTRGLVGLPVSAMSPDQKALFLQVLGDLLKPFRESDQAEAMRYLQAAGIDDLHISYYPFDDIGEDGVWDVWQIEGPHMVWYFRGAPHVHCWAHIKAPTSA